MKKRILCLLMACMLLLSLLAGCGSSASGGSANGAAASGAGEAPQSADTDAGWTEASNASADKTASTLTPALQNAKIILEGIMELQSKEFDEADAFLRQLTADLGGYMESTSVSGDTGYRYASYTARIPQQSYDAFFAQVGEQCHVLSSSSQAQNITEEYVDLEARLSSLQTKHDRLIALLEKADSMETIVALESELADTEYEIERLTGSLRKYDNLVDFSTVHLSLNEVRTLDPVTEGNSFGSELGQAFQNGGRGLLSVLRGLILFVAAAWPLILILGIALAIIIPIVRRRKAKEDALLSVHKHDDNQEPKP